MTESARERERAKAGEADLILLVAHLLEGLRHQPVSLHLARVRTGYEPI